MMVVPQQQHEHPYRIRVSASFLVTTLLSATALAFFVGRFVATSVAQHDDPSRRLATTIMATTKHLHQSQPFHPVASHISAEEKPDALDDDDDDDDDTKYVHFLMDLLVEVDDYRISLWFQQSSRNRLWDDFWDFLQADLQWEPPLSHHCHRQEAESVQSSSSSSSTVCVALLRDHGHVSLRSWPAEHIVSLDIFADQDSVGKLQNLVSSMLRFFGVAAENDNKPLANATVRWAEKKRLFCSGHAGNPEDVDMDLYTLGWENFEWKHVLAESETNFQTIDIFEVINPVLRPGRAAYEKSLPAQPDGNNKTKNNTYYSQHPELFRPEKIIYLDGVMQSSLFGEAAYHEALVHPAMVSHPHPKRVAIIGGGEGATLREVLKHNTVETVTMIEIDKIMVELCQDYLPEWNNCSNLVGSAPSCFDDPRANVIYMDAVAWFTEHFGNQTEGAIDPSQCYDVIIMDALDPNSHSEFCDYLYSNDNFSLALWSSLNENGVLVAQIGSADDGSEPGDQVLRNASGEETFIRHLTAHGFGSVEIYEEDHGGYMDSWQYLVAFKDIETRKLWHYNQAMIDLELQRRAMETRDARTPFRYFDGATMMSYQFPSPLTQTSDCRKLPVPAFCINGPGFDPERPNAPVGAFQVNKSVDLVGNGVFAREDIPTGSYLAIDDRVHGMILPAKTMAMVKELHTLVADKWAALVSFVGSYGRCSSYISGEYLVEPSIVSALLDQAGTSLLGMEQADMIKHNIMFRRNLRAFGDDVRLEVEVKAGEELTGTTRKQVS